MFRIEDTDAARNTEESYDSLLDVDALARLRLGRGPRGRRPATRRTGSPSGRDIYADVLAPAARGRAAPTTATAPTRRSRRAARPSGSKVHGVRRLLPRAHRRAGRGVPRPRAAQPVRAVPDARRRDHLRRPGPRRDHLPDRARARLRARAGQRPPALHAGQPGRRRADGDHPRAARRGPAVLARRARSRSTTRSPSSASPTATPRFGHLPLRDGRGQQEALQARPARPTCSTTASSGFLPEGLLNYLALLGWAIAEDRDIFTIEEMVEAFDIARRQPQPGALRPQEGRGDQRRPHAAAVGRGDRPTGWSRSSQEAGVRRRPGRPPSSAAARRRRCRWSHERINKLTEAVDDAGLPVRRRGATSRATSTRARRRRAAASCRRRTTRSPALADVDHRRDRGGAARRARRGARAQAAQRLRAGPGRGHRPPGLAAAVRVARAARPRPVASPGSPRRWRDRGRARRDRRRTSSRRAAVPPDPARPAAPAGGGPSSASLLRWPAWCIVGAAPAASCRSRSGTLVDRRGPSRTA